MEDNLKMASELVHLARLSLFGNRKDVEFFVKRLVRKLQKWNPEAAEELVTLLSDIPKRNTVVRSTEIDSIPVDRDTRLNLLRIENSPELEVDPILTSKISSELNEIVAERGKIKELLRAGVEPSKAILFVGPPGVGKSLSAKLIAQKLNLPLLVLDLSAVMSSFLGRTGNNIRNIFDFARSSSCVLFLDEIDAIAKKRDDAAEVGELKRLVTVLLQELDNWPSDNLIIAATNHDDLLDPAIWRRFDRIVKFDIPDIKQVQRIIDNELMFNQINSNVLNFLPIALSGQSHSEIIRQIKNLKKTAILANKTFEEVFRTFIETSMDSFSHDNRIKLAEELAKDGKASQRKISKLTGVSRDTIRRKVNTREGDL